MRCVIFILSGCRDSNPESLAPKASMLAVTPHPDVIYCNNVDHTNIQFEKSEAFIQYSL